MHSRSALKFESARETTTRDDRQCGLARSSAGWQVEEFLEKFGPIYAKRLQMVLTAKADLLLASYCEVRGSMMLVS